MNVRLLYSLLFKNKLPPKFTACIFGLIQMSIASTDSSKVSSQRVLERKMSEKLENLKQSGKPLLRQIAFKPYKLLQVQ